MLSADPARPGLTITGMRGGTMIKRFTNPIVARELMAHLRQPRAFFHLFILLGCVCALFCLVYAYASRGWTLENRDGRQIFFPVIYLAMLIAIPISAMAAASIVREREEETLDLLLTTPMRQRAILWGKLLASVVYALLILTSLLPFVSICLIVGGLSLSEVSQSLFAVTGFYCAVAMAGVLVSLLSVSTNAATRYSIMALLVVYFGPLAARFIMLALYTRPPLSLFIGVDLWINPLFAVALIQNPSGVTTFFSSQYMDTLPAESFSVQLFQLAAEHPGWVSGGLNLAMTVLLFGAAAMLFRLWGNQLTNQFSPWRTRRAARAEPRRGDGPDNGLEPSEGGGDGWSVRFGLSDDAVYLRENLTLNRRFLTRDSTIAAGSLAITAGITWLSLNLIVPQVNEVPTYLIHYMLCVFGIVIVALFTPIHPSYSLLTERRKDTWPLLRTTMLSSSEIVRGKIYSGVRQSALPLFTIMGVFYLTFLAYFYIHRIQVDNHYLAPFLCLLFFFMACNYAYAAAGVYFSSLARRVRSSPHRRTFAVVLAHFFLPYLIYFLAIVISFLVDPYSSPADGPAASAVEQYILPLSPIWIAGQFTWPFIQYVIVAIHGTAAIGVGLWLTRRAADSIQQPDM